MCVHDIHAHSKYLRCLTFTALRGFRAHEQIVILSRALNHTFHFSLNEALQRTLHMHTVFVCALLLLHCEEVAADESSDGKPGGSVASLSSASGGQVRDASAGRLHVSGFM